MSKWIAPLLLSVMALAGCRTVDRSVAAARSQLPDAPVTTLQIPTTAPNLQNSPIQQVDYQQVVEQPDQIAVNQSTQIDVTLAELEQMALAANPVIAQRQAEIESLYGKLTQAGLPANPKAGVIGEDINEDGSAGRYGVFLGREIVRGNKLGLSRSTVRAEICAAEHRLAIIRQRLLTDVRQRYYELLVAQEKLEVADELVAISENAVDVSKKLVEAGEAARTDLLQSELEFQNSKVVRRQAQNERIAARRKLAALFAEADLPTVNVSGDPRTLLQIDDFEQSFDQLVNDSPEIAALFADVERARRQLARENVEAVPNVTWQTTVQYDTAGDRVVAGFLVGMPIPIINRNQGAICQARQQVTVAQRKVETRALDLRQRLASAYESYLDAKLQVDALDSEILPNATETLQLVTQGYEQGEVAFLQLLTVQRTYSRLNLNYLEKLQQLWQRDVEIRGMLLNGSLK